MPHDTDFFAPAARIIWRHRAKSYNLDCMRYLFALSPLFIVVAVSSFCTPVTWADGNGSTAPDRVGNPTSRQYDQRLPPVIPGEEVVTEGGQRMRVWSSSGPVPINPVPTPQTLNGNGNGTGYGPAVIVDGRIDRPILPNRRP